jgi:hypothetical protein
MVQSIERELPKSSSQGIGLVLETQTERRGEIMGFLVLLIVAIGTMMIAVSAATGILHLLFQFMDTAAVPQEIGDRR